MTTINFRCDDEVKKTLRDEAISLGYKNLSDYMNALFDNRKGAKTVKKVRKLMPVGRGERS